MPDQNDIEVARYQFHSWSRKGIASRVSEPDDLGDHSSTTAERVSVEVQVQLNGVTHLKSFSLIGPGDITGINRDMIVRTEPLRGLMNVEPNYLAFIEFYDEDFAWRYTPAAAVTGDISPATSYRTGRLRPWLLLLVLKEEEFGRTTRRVPLGSIQLKISDVFPPSDESWLWAHVHSNADIPDEDLTDEEKFLISLNKTIDDDPDKLYCRLMSPRKLEANTSYTAFVVPAFETGRLAGLELSTDGVVSQLASWTDNNEGLEIPVYYEWSFGTGDNADFESLVTALAPVAMDQRVGIRDMDCHDPGFTKAYTDEIFPGTHPPLIGLEGALKSPATVSTIFPDPADPGEFPKALEEIINLPIDIIGESDSGDPIISIPLYGGNHAKRSAEDKPRFYPANPAWLHALNKDPRTRVAAGFGTRVVQDNQENYMQKAWQQVINIIRANQLITLTQFHMNIAFGFSKKIFTRLPQALLLTVSKPVLRRVPGSPVTLYQQIQDSRLPTAIFSGAFRRIARPRRLKVLSGDEPFDMPGMINLINDDKLSAAPAVTAPGGVPNTKDFADKILPRPLSPLLKWIVKNRKILLTGLIILFALLAILSSAFILFAALAASAMGGYVYINKLNTADKISRGLNDPQTDLENIIATAPRPNFTLRLSDEAVTPAPTITSGTADSVEAAKFRSALVSLARRMVIQAPEKEICGLNIDNAYKKAIAAIDPAFSFTRRLTGLVKFPGNIDISKPEKVFPAMAYPDFEDPMYKKLADISSELLLPNLKLIPDNCISLLKTNPKFIESYLVGLNHEMGRELLWREYPTDQRGSYFRQFWDVNGIVRPGDAGSGQKNKDIIPIDTWGGDSELGKHNSRTTQGESPEKLVLVIRGELLRKYPGTVIFAQKAVAGTEAGKPIIIEGLTNEQFAVQVKFPLFKAEIAPDIRFFGFDLTIEQARGEQLSDNFNDSLGWFFCIAQAPGEARFGMDIGYTAGEGSITWDNLAWTNLPNELKFITRPVVPDVPGLNDMEKNRWAIDSATMADILFQKPSMVAVHASQMLKSLTN